MLKISVFLQHKERLKERETDREQNMETGWIRQNTKKKQKERRRTWRQRMKV